MIRSSVIYIIDTRSDRLYPYLGVYSSKYRPNMLPPNSNKLKDFHVKLLTQYNHDELNSDIKKVAKIDEEFSEITQVLNHRFKGSKKNLANLELYLTWEDDPKPQWFPWNSSFRSVEVIHRYFEDNQMRRFIPTEFTWGKDHSEYIPPDHSRKQRS